MRPEALRPGLRVSGLLRTGTATIVAADHLGPDAIQLTYRDDAGSLSERILFADELAKLAEAATESRWSFDADGAHFRLAMEATRMRLASLFDPMLAISTSQVEPLPHQIRAVYGEMLAKPGPLRFLLADDPGAGKTIMAGLYLKELILRGDVQRCLVVAPGGLVEQWQSELAEKFGLELTILTRALADADREGNPFRTNPMLIARMDQLARAEEWQEHLKATEWDLVVVDEAHRMSAHWFGGELKRTRRYELGRTLGGIARHLLLMTATPHAGKEEDFQAFLALLDPDRFEGAYRAGAHSTDTSGLMRRMVKEDLLTFEGKPLFPERVAETVTYALSPREQRLYEEVTEYVRTEMNRADALDDGTGRRRTVGFALTVLQRRLASSPEAIYQSLRRRSARLRSRRDELAHVGTTTPWAQPPGALTTVTGQDFLDLDDDEFDAQELEELEEQVLDSASAARTVAELDLELAALDRLQEIAAQVRAAGEDRKWVELRDLVQSAGTNDAGVPRKLIVFTEHRDTLDYLARRLESLLGTSETVVAIHGGTPRIERRRITARFTNDPRCQILLATDAAGEGLNLQAAHLMVNYDLPWNPNRIEQRFGRIHRIGQREVCRLWNLVAADTREGQVFIRLLDKIEEQRRAYGGKVFDVLGESAFAEQPLRDLLMEAIRYGEQPDVRARLDQVIDKSVADGLSEMLQERSLASPEFAQADLAELRRQMDEARARRLQPHYIGLFVLEALRALGGRVAGREKNRYEITHIPAALRAGTRPVAPRYARVTFEPSAIDSGETAAELIAPGHPVFDTLVEQVLDRWGDALERGATVVDDTATSPRLLLALLGELVDGTNTPVSRRLDFVTIGTDNAATLTGPAPHLDIRPLATAEAGAATSARDSLTAGPWLAGAAETRVHQLATSWAVQHGLPAHRAEVIARLEPLVEKTRTLVRKRLNAQVNHWYAESARLAEAQAAGKKIRVSPATAKGRAEDLEARLVARERVLDLEAQVSARPPRVIAAALILPSTVLTAVADEQTMPDGRPVDTTITERRAVDAVLAAERALGRDPVEMNHSNKGYDIASANQDGSTIFLEVKGRVLGADDFIVTLSEVLFAKNAEPGYRLALVSVDPDQPDGNNDQVRYVRNPFSRLTLDRYTDKVVRKWKATWTDGTEPM